MKQEEEEKIMQEVISYMENFAYGRSENKECAMLTGIHKHTYKGHAFNHAYEILVWNWANDVELLHRHGILSDEILSKSKEVILFQYCFEKSIEIFYSEEIHAEFYDETIFPEEALNGNGYELSIPEELHIKVNSVTPQIVLLAGIVYDYMAEKGYYDLPVSTQFYAYYGAAASLAKQFLVEQDIGTHLIKQKMKNIFLFWMK